MENPATGAAKRKIRVMIVEDQISIRQMLAVMIGAMPEFEVAGQAGEVDEALRLACRLRPDVVILDWIFPGGGGAGFLQAMQSSRLPGHVLVMSAGTDGEAIREALTSGAKGYIEKVASIDEFKRALRAVAGGGVYFGPVVAGVVERLVKYPAYTTERFENVRVMALPAMASVPA